MQLILPAQVLGQIQGILLPTNLIDIRFKTP
jgi:hypothetical protein